MKIEIYGKPGCPYCLQAQQLCQEQGWIHAYINIEADPGVYREFLMRTGFAKTVPQIFVDDRLIGGFDQFSAAVERGAFKENRT